jgi:hypothetical protein
MTIVQQPQRYCFASMMQDFIIDSDASINFTVKYKGQKILDETYCPDADYRITIRKLGALCRMALWGLWYGTTETVQSNAYGDFTFYINDILQQMSTVVYARLATSKNAESVFTAGGVLSRVLKKVTRRGVSEYLTFVVPANVPVGVCTLKGSVQGDKKTIRIAGDALAVVTLDVSSDILFPNVDIDGYRIMCGETFDFIIDKGSEEDLSILRYKNIFDCPETMIMRGGITMEGENTSETAEIGGVTRKAVVTPKDSFTLSSGSFYLATDYLLFHDIANAQEVSILCDATWVPIIIDKQTFKKSSKRTFEEVTYNVSAAEPEHETLIL